MCGICGAYGLSDQELLKKMCSAMMHRGPDDEGHYFDSDVMLGMRRLKVIDLATGSQPIYNEDRSVVVVYNGEIYNYMELRDELVKAGHIFKTNSDTETIVHLYEEYGDDFINRLRGMFAFALWDAERKRLILARDRIGIKPLYYYFKNGILLFASEIKSLLVYPEISREINYNALHDYLTFGYVPAPNTIFADIYKLLPGYMLLCEDGKVTIKQYWDINNGDYKELSEYDENELSAQLLRLMEESIRMHLISDVPLGVFLSGGTDSSTITALASEIFGRPLKTFSIGFEDDYHNELYNAGLVAKRYRTEHHEFVVKPAHIDLLEDILYYFDEPFADSSAIPTYFVSRCARGDVTVALSGDGGDEVFGGYGNYKADKIGLVYRRLPTFIKDKIIPFGIDKFIHETNYYSKGQQIRKVMNMANLPPEHGHIFWLSCFGEDGKRELYKREEFKECLKHNSLDRYMTFFVDRNNNDFINKCIYTDIKTVLPDDYLTKVDRMSMANSLEVRVPLLDHKLVEFALCIPSKYKLRGLTTKYLLKKIMRDKLPKEIINGKKMGFSIPLAKWFTEDFSKLINEYLSKGIIQKRGYFNYDFVEFLSNDHFAGRKDNSKLLWTLICFEIWHRRYVG